MHPQYYHQQADSLSDTNHGDFLFVESAGGRWSLHCGPYQCTSSSCLYCLLSTLGEIRGCPWHCTMAQDTQHHYTVAHLIGVDCGNGKANVIGYIGSLPLHTHLILIHIIPETKLVNVVPGWGILVLLFGFTTIFPVELCHLAHLNRSHPLFAMLNSFPTLSCENGWSERTP